MHALPLACLALLALLAGAIPDAQARTLRFSGHEFVVRQAGVGGPGPNNWSARNAWVDEQGRLHLKLARRGGKWYAAEVYTRQRLGFGRYEFRIETNLDRLDRNVVLGLFHYPTSDVGPDATHEIDIEFARWGRRSGAVGNYTVWPVDAALDYTTRRFRMPANAARTTHVYHRSADKVTFTSWRGHGTGSGRRIARWRFAPRDAAARISQEPMPLHINLWGHRGNPPSDGRDVEVIISSFSFTPE